MVDAKQQDKSAEQGRQRAEKERSGFLDLKPTDYPLTIVVTDDVGQEVHHTQLDGPAGRTVWDDLVSPDLEDRYPGKKMMRVSGASGKVVHEQSLGEDKSAVRE